MPFPPHLNAVRLKDKCFLSIASHIAIVWVYEASSYGERSSKCYYGMEDIRDVRCDEDDLKLRFLLKRFIFLVSRTGRVLIYDAGKIIHFVSRNSPRTRLNMFWENLIYFYFSWAEKNGQKVERLIFLPLPLCVCISLLKPGYTIKMQNIENSGIHVIYCYYYYMKLCKPVPYGSLSHWRT